MIREAYNFFISHTFLVIFVQALIMLATPSNKKNFFAENVGWCVVRQHYTASQLYSFVWNPDHLNSFCGQHGNLRKLTSS